MQNMLYRKKGIIRTLLILRGQNST